MPAAHRMRRAPKAQRGFMLLELLVAFAILAVALGLLYRAAGGSVRHVGETERHVHAVALAESLLASYDAVPAGGLSGQGESAGFSWQVRSEPYPTALQGTGITPLHQVSVLVAWGDAGRNPHQLALFTVLPQQGPIPGAVAR